MKIIPHELRRYISQDVVMDVWQRFHAKLYNPVVVQVGSQATLSVRLKVSEGASPDRLFANVVGTILSQGEKDTDRHEA